MRILAIRGCNLASLAGEFEIDLAHGALGAAGVFAIVGPTGAGKSTLLDAMCVALFDRTPRLANRSTVIVGRDDDPANLGAQDVRSLLRRGASAGYAEVDFESGDARRYRARWSVRRARGAIDGRFQNQQVTLTAIEGGEAIGGTKTETLEAIHQRLGLSFDQFRRSALLAQGEFAAFLRADGKDRSELLERMTGTEIYSKLSIAAHVKAALAQQDLRERHGAALAIAVLPDDERERGESELVLAKQAQTASRARFAAAEAAARWLAEADLRAGALVEAEASRVEVERAVENAAAERAELALRRRAETLRSPWEEATRLDRQLALVRSDATVAGQAADQAGTAQREIEAARGQLVALHGPIREARLAAALLEIANAQRGANLVTRATVGAASAAWLLERRDLGLAVAGWQHLEHQLVQQTMLAADIAASDKTLDDRARKRDQLAAQRTGAVTAHQAAIARLAEATVEAATYQQKRGLSLDAARRAEDEARRHCLELERLTAIAGEARGAATARAEFDLQLAELATAAATDVSQRRTAETERDRAGTLRTERSLMVDELRKAAGYAHARTELVDGDPCPLCGAPEHPWRDRGAFDALIGDAQARLAEVNALSEIAVTVLATLTAREAQRTKEHARLTACRATAETTAVAAQRTWREHLASLGELLLVDDPASAAAHQLAEERVDAAKLKLDATRAARSQAEAAAKAAGEAQARVQTRQADVEQHVHTLREVDASIAAVDAAAERLRGERTGKAERLRDMLAAIDASLARWYVALAAGDAARPILELAREALAGVLGGGASASVVGPASVEPAAVVAATSRAKRATKRRAGESLPDAGAEGGGASGVLASAWSSNASSSVAGGVERRGPSTLLDVHGTALLDRCRRALSELAAGWATHADVIATLDAELTAAIAAGEAAAREAERVLAEQVARRDAANARREAAFAELSNAAAVLDTARIAAGFDSEELRRLLTDSPARAETLAQQLDTLERAAERVRTLVTERRRLVDDHAMTSPFGQAPASHANVARTSAVAHADVARTSAVAHAGVARTDGAAHADVARSAAGAHGLSGGEADVPGTDVDRADLQASAANVAHAVNLRADALRVPELDAMVASADHHAAALAAALAADADARARRTAALAQFAAAEQAAEVDRVLGEVIGSHDGKLFRSFAQSLTLDGLLAVANSHLEELAPRYQLERVPKHDLELQVIDRDLGNEIRSVQSLSGGESFLVSLALALGLSSMSAHDVRVRTLLIDEGFGTLDPATLDGALAVLDALQATGRQVGVISHVPALVERVGAHVRVSPRGGGRSEVVVAEA